MRTPSRILSSDKEVNIMRTHTVTVVLRSVLGLIFVVGPLGTALHWFAEPELPPGGTAFVTALMQTGYMLPLVWTTEIVAGGLLVLGRLVPLALVLLAPVIVNIVAFHIFLAPGGLAITVLLGALEIALAWQHRAAFRPLFTHPSSRAEVRSAEALSATAA
jgi:uncharacterized membrane protein YphA (DoxX/SURF4 family)